MKIKHKVTLALFILFLLILGLGGVGSYYIKLLSVNSSQIIKDNYRTLQYLYNIDNSLDILQYELAVNEQAEPEQKKKAVEQLRKNVELQNNNITERGERDLSAELTRNTDQLIAAIEANNRLKCFEFIHSMEQNLNQLYHMNEDALLNRNQQTQATADKAVLYMLTISICVLVVALIVLFTFPRFVAKPINQLSDSIKQVAKGNYQIQISLSRKDEFGDIARSFNKMVAKLKDYEESSYMSLLEERNRLDAVINQMSEGIIGLNASKEILFANKRVLKLLNLKEDQLIGKYAPDVAVNNDLLQALLRGLMIPIPEWEERKFKPVTITEDKKEKLFAKDIVDIIQKTIGEDREYLSGHVILLTDVTEFSEREKAKTAFMSTLSHELKTPVAAIEMGTQLLRNHKLGSLSEEQEEWLKTIDENNQRIKQSINQILDLSKIERGLIEINKSSINPELIIDQAINAVGPFTKEKKLSINTEIDRPLPNVLVDSHKIAWVLNNILINAIRYTPSSKSILVKGMKVNSHRVRISVKDEGPGISRENQKLIFERFKRATGDRTEGLGLGLAISKEFIEAMDGHIGVSSQQGQGAEFWVELRAVS